MDVLRFFRPPPTPTLPAPPVKDIWCEIDRLKINYSAFGFLKFDKSEIYHSVSLRREVSGSYKVEATGEGRTFDEALADAWAKWPGAAS